MTPPLLGRSISRARVAETSSTLTPSQGQTTRPELMMDRTTGTEVKLPTEKPMPWAELTTMVFTPTTSPRMLTSGPPLFPSLIAASV